MVHGSIAVEQRKGFLVFGAHEQQNAVRKGDARIKFSTGSPKSRKVSNN